MKMSKNYKNLFFQKIVFLFLIFIFGIFGLFLKTKNYYSGKGELIFFDVGQGDAIFIKTPQNFTILIDGGPSKKIIYELSEVLPFWERKIDVVILTHPHLDHLIGLNEVLKYYKIGEFWFNGLNYNSPEYHQLIKTIKEKNIPTKIVKMGDFKKFQDGSYLEILWPRENLYNKNVDDLNFYSIVCRFRFGENKFLFLGDATQEAQKQILENFDLEAIIFKVPHHGAENAILEKFLEDINSKYSVICVNKNNKFGHPSPATLSVLEKYNLKIFRTDQMGRIKFRFDKEEFFEENNSSLTNIFLFLYSK